MKWPREYKGRPESMQELESYVPSTENLIGVPDFSELDGSGKMVKRGVRNICVSMIVSFAHSLSLVVLLAHAVSN